MNTSLSAGGKGYRSVRKSKRAVRHAVDHPRPECSVEFLEDRCYLASQAYNWQNAPFGGGGFVTGIVYSPTVPNLVYARTDVGGAYRWDQSIGRWTPLTDWMTYTDPASMGVEALAIDPNDSNRLYATVGTYTALWAGNAAVLRSIDRGQTWQRTNVSFKMGGNDNGRSNGERLMVDPNSDNIILLATPDNGLWKSTDYGATWNQLPGFPVTTTADGVGLNFVQFVKSSGTAGSATPTIYVGVSQTVNNLYRSTDGGTTWQNVSNAALDSTQMPARAAQDLNGNMYVTFGIGPGPNGVDNSTGTLAGSVWKLALGTGTWTNITPNTNGQGGFSGVSVDAEHPNTLVITTMDRWWPSDDVYRSTNGGSTWTSLRGTDQPYPQNLTDKIQWDSGSGFGWPGDIEIDPFNANHVMVSYGGGIASSFDLTSADTGAATHWNYFVNGLEETVQLALVSPPSGAPLLTAAGDVAGSRFADLASPPSGYTTMPGSNRDIDFAETNSNLLVRSGDVSPNIVYSRDNGITWTAFPSVPANTGTGTGSIDNAGMLAMSADGNTVVWDPGDDSSNNLKFPLSYSTWNGGTWSSWTTSTWSGSADVHPISDRLNANDFYILDGTNLYESTNRGASWTLKSSSAPSGTLYAAFAASGDLWITSNGNGLWHSTNFGATWTRVASSNITNAYQVGFGKAAPGQSYPAIYIAGSANSTTGFFRSDDGGATWITISDAQHQWAYVNQIVGDRNVYGRVYIGAGARGIIYGDIQSTAPSVATAAAATPVIGNTTNLSVLGSDDGSESNLTYTWRVTKKPPGVTAPTFSINGSNAAKNTVATFSQPGYYSFQVAIIDAQNHIMISSVGLTVSIPIGIFTTAQDIGSPSPAGSSSYNSTTGTYTVRGSGSDIWNNSDQFQFLSTNFNGDGTIIAHVTSVQNTDTWAKGGVMIRDTTAANAMFADVVVAATSGVSFQWRNSTGGYADDAAIYGPQPPEWVKLIRTGNSFTGFYASTSGTPSSSDWIQIGTPETIPMGSSTQAGLATTSHSSGNLCSSTFTNVQVLPAWLGSGSLATWNPSIQTLTVTGVTSIVGDPGNDEPIIQATASASQITVNPTTVTQIHVGSINLTNGATLTMSDTASPQVLIVAAGANNFSIDSTSKFNLGKNYLDLQNSGGNIAAVDTLLQRGFGNGTWNGTGLTSSDANTDSTHRTALGSIINGNQFNSTNKFDGATPGSNDVLIRYTYTGDADLSGTVTGNDYSLIDAGFGSATLKGWQNGDFNYDNHIDGSDYSMIDNVFNQQASPLAEFAASVVASKPAPPVTSPNLGTTKAMLASPATGFAASSTAPTIDEDWFFHQLHRKHNPRSS